MMLFTKEITSKLLANGRQQQPLRGTPGEMDFKPVVKLFTPWGSATWLLSELDPEEPDIAFGLCDLGIGFPELGNVSISELRAVKGLFGLTVERDRHFEAKKTLSAYAEEARRLSRINA